MTVLPFTRRGVRPLKALTDERLRRISGLAAALQHEVTDAEHDFECGAPYVGTPLRLGELPDLSGLILDVSEDLLRKTNSRS